MNSLFVASRTRHLGRLPHAFLSFAVLAGVLIPPPTGHSGETLYASAALNASIEDNVYRSSTGREANAAQLFAEAGRRFAFHGSSEAVIFYNGSTYYFPSISSLNLAVHGAGITISSPLGSSMEIAGTVRGDFRRGSGDYSDLNFNQLDLSTEWTRMSTWGSFGAAFEVRMRGYAVTGPGYTAYEPAVFVAGRLGRAQWRIDAGFGHKSLDPSVVSTQVTDGGGMMGGGGMHGIGGMGDMTIQIQTVPQASVERGSIALTVSRPLGPQMGMRLGATYGRVLSGVSPYFPGLDILQNGYAIERFDDAYSFQGWSGEARLTRLLPLHSQLVLIAIYRSLDYPGRPAMDKTGKPLDPFLERADREGIAQLKLAKALAARGPFERLAVTASFTYYRNSSNDQYYRATDRMWLLGFEFRL
ncbi:MAG: hypothetical protein AB1714_16335 [Acidobacteriota bacterium]